MQDRPDLIESELSGLAFDSCQQVFKSPDLEVMFAQKPPPMLMNEAIHVFIDPAAGGPQSDYAVLSVTRQKGMITVRKSSKGQGRAEGIRVVLESAQGLHEDHEGCQDGEHAFMRVRGFALIFFLI